MSEIGDAIQGKCLAFGDRPSAQLGDLSDSRKLDRTERERNHILHLTSFITYIFTISLNFAT